MTDDLCERAPWDHVVGDPVGGQLRLVRESYVELHLQGLLGDGSEVGAQVKGHVGEYDHMGLDEVSVVGRLVSLSFSSASGCATVVSKKKKAGSFQFSISTISEKFLLIFCAHVSYVNDNLIHVWGHRNCSG